MINTVTVSVPAQAGRALRRALSRRPPARRDRGVPPAAPHTTDIGPNEENRLSARRTWVDLDSGQLDHTSDGHPALTVAALVSGFRRLTVPGDFRRRLMSFAGEEGVGLQAMAQMDLLGLAFVERRFSAGDHRSGLRGVGDDNRGVDNANLEYIGDQVLNMIVATQVLRRKPMAATDRLRREAYYLRSNEHLANVVLLRLQGVAPLVLRLRGLTAEYVGAREVSAAAGGRGLADVMEGIIGCLYLQGGVSAATEFVYRHVLDAGVIEASTRRTRPGLGPVRDPALDALLAWDPAAAPR